MNRADAGSALDKPEWRRLRVILTLLVAARGVMLMCVLPPFEAWDEYQHLAYIAHLNETGERPRFGLTEAPSALLEQLPHFPQPRSALDQIKSTGALGYQEYWASVVNGSPDGPPAQPPGRIILYQAQHGPLYYRLMAPLFQTLGGISNLRASIAGLRLVNLLLTAASVWVAFGIIARRVKNPAIIAFSGILIATQPLFLMNGVRVANDALGVFLATIAIGWALELPRILTTRRAIISSIGLGALTGVAVLAKSVHFGLIPFVAVAWLWGVARIEWKSPSHVEFWRAAVAALGMAAAFLSVTQAEFRDNWRRYGSATVMQASIMNRQAGRGGIGDLVAAAREVSWRRFAETVWLRKNVMSGGWSWAGSNQRVQDRHEFLVLAGLLGWGWCLFPRYLRRRGRLFDDPAIPCLCVAVCLGYSASLGYHTLQTQLCWDADLTCPWYAAAAHPWFLLLVAAGATLWPLGRLRTALPALTIVFFLETQAAVILGSMLTTYTAGAAWGEGLRRLASLQPRFLGTTTLYLAMASALFLTSLALTEAARVIRRSSPANSGHRPHVVTDDLAGTDMKIHEIEQRG